MQSYFFLNRYVKTYSNKATHLKKCTSADDILANGNLQPVNVIIVLIFYASALTGIRTDPEV